mmetsp:Transcript_31/g.98  ORF Transcript_31/g.98 Transcript_31/m.98 type:complete len:224 (-) Transcript_31:461-1132(-)
MPKCKGDGVTYRMLSVGFLCCCCCCCCCCPSWSPKSKGGNALTAPLPVGPVARSLPGNPLLLNPLLNEIAGFRRRNMLLFMLLCVYRLPPPLPPPVETTSGENTLAALKFGAPKKMTSSSSRSNDVLFFIIIVSTLFVCATVISSAPIEQSSLNADHMNGSNSNARLKQSIANCRLPVSFAILPSKCSPYAPPGMVAFSSCIAFFCISLFVALSTFGFLFSSP